MWTAVGRWSLCLKLFSAMFEIRIDIDRCGAQSSPMLTTHTHTRIHPIHHLPTHNLTSNPFFQKWARFINFPKVFMFAAFILSRADIKDKNVKIATATTTTKTWTQWEQSPLDGKQRVNSNVDKHRNGVVPK